MESELGGTGGLGVRVRSPLFQHPRVFNGEERRRPKSPCERMNEPPNERNDWPLLDLLRRFEVTPKNNQRAVCCWCADSSLEK